MKDIKALHHYDLEALLTALLHVRDSDSKYIALRPADVFQDWFLELIPGASKSITALGCSREELDTITAKLLDGTFNTEKKNEPTSR